MVFRTRAVRAVTACVLSSMAVCGIAWDARADGIDHPSLESDDRRSPDADDRRSPSGSADTSGLSFDWIAPAGCPDRADARAAIARYVDVTAIDPSHPVAVRVELEPQDDGDWQGKVELRSPVAGSDSLVGRGERQFRGPTCDQVSQAAILIVAIMLDPLRTTARVNEAAPPGPTRTDEPRGELGLQTSGDLGSLPSATLGFGLDVGVRSGRMLLQALATYWASERAVGGPSASSGGQVGLTTGGLRGCFDAIRTRADGFRLGLCAHGELGVASGIGFGVDQPVHSSALWSAAFAGLSMWLSAAPLSTWLSIEAGTPLVRPVYAIEGYGNVFQASSVLLRASSGVAWTFP